MSKVRTEIWLVGIVIVVVTIPGYWMYMSATATVHPNPEDVPTVRQSAPAATWAGPAERARQRVRAALIERNLPGLSVAVGVGGEIVWAEGFGLADLENRVAVTPDHRFRIGTASIALTSAAVGLLVEKGRLNLDDPIQKYVPSFPQKQWPVTLRQIMGHTAGVRSDSGDEGPLFGEHCERPVDALKEFGDKPLLFEPGTEYRYSRYGWILLSAAVETAAGQPFLTFMREQVFDPLRMNDTMADPGTKPVSDRVTFYFPRFAADPVYGQHLMRDIDLSCYAGAGVFLSTASDIVRFAIGSQSGKLLQRSTVELLQTAQRTTSGAETGYGLGWDLETVTFRGKQTRVVGHDGDVLGGKIASLLVFPEYGIYVGVTSNISYADTFSLGVEVAELFAAEGKGPAAARAPVAIRTRP